MLKGKLVMMSLVILRRISIDFLCLLNKQRCTQIRNFEVVNTRVNLELVNGLSLTGSPSVSLLPVDVSTSHIAVL
jgi:hypothetical protein